MKNIKPDIKAVIDQVSFMGSIGQYTGQGFRQLVL